MYALSGDRTPQGIGRGMRDRPLVEDDRDARGEGANEPVPHHPSRRRDEEELVAAAEVRMEPVLFHVLEERSSRAVHDALRLSGGPRGKEYERRMVEWKAR